MKKIIFYKAKEVYRSKRRLGSIDSSVGQLTFEEESKLPNGIAPCAKCLIVNDEDLEDVIKIIYKHEIRIFSII